MRPYKPYTGHLTTLYGIIPDQIRLRHDHKHKAAYLDLTMPDLEVSIRIDLSSREHRAADAGGLRRLAELATELADLIETDVDVDQAAETISTASPGALAEARRLASLTDEQLIAEQIDAEAARCDRCGRVAGMPSAPCNACPDWILGGPVLGK